MDHIRSIAFAKKVTLKGSTIELYPPPILYTTTEAIIDIKNNIQYKPVDFFVVSMLKNFDKNKANQTIIIQALFISDCRN